jgi:phasin protein
MMNEIRKPEFGELGASLAQVSSEATRRLCEQGQSAIQTVTEWNAEIGQFLSHRAARNGEALRRVAQCQNLPDIFGIQAQWVQDATEDYLREIGKFTEFNSRIMGGWVGSLGTAVAPVPFESRTPPAKDRSDSRKVTASGSAA